MGAAGSNKLGQRAATSWGSEQKLAVVEVRSVRTEYLMRTLEPHRLVVFSNCMHLYDNLLVCHVDFPFTEGFFGALPDFIL